MQVERVREKIECVIIIKLAIFRKKKRKETRHLSWSACNENSFNLWTQLPEFLHFRKEQPDFKVQSFAMLDITRLLHLQIIMGNISLMLICFWALHN